MVQISINNNTTTNNQCHTWEFLMGARESECQISQNYILQMKVLEFYLYNHDSCEI